MTSESQIYQQIENELEQSIVSSTSIGGGSIGYTKKIKMTDGQAYFLKYATVSHGKMFVTEANSLRELHKAKSILIPEVCMVGDHFLLLDFIDSYAGLPPPHFFQQFGQQFAEMHRFQGKTFGFYEDNFIGLSPQINTCTLHESQDWAAFYFNKRLMFQYYLAEKKGYATPSLRKALQQLENRIEIILEGSKEPPTLLHGDLWSGNFLVDSTGTPCIIDPAVYYGHREADLAMTKLFGGFSPDFYHAYQESYPLPPDYQYRENLYKLYHIINHLNIFGQGYYGQVMSLINYYI